MNISDLIKLATDVLASQGDIQVDLEVNGERFLAKGVDIQNRNSTSKQRVMVVYGNEKDNYK